MFTGIIQELGKITKIEKGKEKTTFTIKAKEILEEKKVGQSIAVNGACMTITEIEKESFKFDAIPESLDLTNLGLTKQDEEVNLEAALKLNQSLDGHLVQGHVDSMAEVLSFNKNNGKVVLKIKIPKGMEKYFALKGSISINGVSLTISFLNTSSFSVDLIPHTLKETNLKNLKKGNKVNLEIDIIARYLQRQLDNKEGESKYSYLLERGFI